MSPKGDRPLRRSLVRALIVALGMLATADARAAVGEQLVRERFSIQTMAAALAGIYADLYADPRGEPSGVGS